MTGNRPCSSPPTSAVENAPSAQWKTIRSGIAGSDGGKRALCAHLIHCHQGCQGAQPGTWTLPRSQRPGPLRQAPLTILFVLGHRRTDPESRPIADGPSLTKLALCTGCFRECHVTHQNHLGHTRHMAQKVNQHPTLCPAAPHDTTQPRSRT
jgi:hypothetical protein